MSKTCPSHQILNKTTGRCVKKTGKIGKRIIKELVDVKLSSAPLTSSPLDEKKCPSHKILNKTTGRCVKKTGKIGKRIIKELVDVKLSSSPMSSAPLGEDVKSSSAPLGEKKCPSHKILNKTTGRCVKKTGKIGKRIIKELVDVKLSSAPLTSSPLDKLAEYKLAEYKLSEYNSDTERYISELRKLVQGVGYPNSKDLLTPSLILLNHVSTISSNSELELFLYMIVKSFDTIRYRNFINHEGSNLAFLYTRCAFTEELVTDAFFGSDLKKTRTEMSEFENAFDSKSGDIKFYSIEFSNHILTYIINGSDHYIIQSYYYAYTVTAPYGLLKLNEQEVKRISNIFKVYDLAAHYKTRYRSSLPEKIRKYLVKADWEFQRYTGIISRLHMSDIAEDNSENHFRIYRLNGSVKFTDRDFIKNILTNIPDQSILKLHYEKNEKGRKYKQLKISLNWGSYLTPWCVIREYKLHDPVFLQSLFLSGEYKTNTYMYKEFVVSNEETKFLISHISYMSGMDVKIHSCGISRVINTPFCNISLQRSLDKNAYQRLVAKGLSLFYRIERRTAIIHNNTRAGILALNQNFSRVYSRVYNG